MSATAKVIELKGDKRKPESSETIIVFPGGSISVCRTSNNEYWAHIDVNDNQIIPDTIRESKQGEIINSRLDYRERGGHVENFGVKDLSKINHIAVRIKTKE